MSGSKEHFKLVASSSPCSIAHHHHHSLCFTVIRYEFDSGLNLTYSHSALRHLSPLLCRRYLFLGEACVLLSSPVMNFLPGSSTIAQKCGLFLEVNISSLIIFNPHTTQRESWYVLHFTIGNLRSEGTYRCEKCTSVIITCRSPPLSFGF